MRHLKLKRKNISGIRMISSCSNAVKVLVFGLILFPCLNLTADGQDRSPIRDIIENSAASSSFWSFQVRNSSGDILDAYNGDFLIRPASNLKLVTSAAYLDQLGPDFQFETNLYGSGEQSGNRWNGDLYIRGAGDPSINGEAYEDPMFLFQHWFSKLDSMGVEVIDGNIIGHHGYFDDVPYPRGWEWDDLSYYYAPEISALSFNQNVVDLEVRADGDPGSKPSITWFPFETPYVQFINEQRITPASTSFDESYRRELGSNTIYLRSTLPEGHYETEPLSVHNPSLYFIDTFKRYLQLMGIRVEGQLLLSDEPIAWNDGGFTELHSHRSQPLHTMIDRLNRESDNLYAEMLLKTLVAERYGVPGSTELGLELVKGFMNTHGFDTTAVELRDASGMAPATLLKTSDLNRFLVDMQQKPYFDIYYNSLSIAGRNGTLQYRFYNSNIASNFFGKTGFMSGVRSISGYLNTAGGERLVVTIATNNYTVRTAVVDRIHQQILDYLYSRY
ncbi:D-alanyl-D-alanine carboxypeptidase/D-alanyl-D-alanine endopeptidase [Rhodohalobacter sp. 8-1]|uniref:D-alanyl-D-alanine carboxypeptidase/D-alanyl-D-alanine endopeptidase n=1 Tax=Rhodohalobacter sp. 8-1 TaxID=3131972 RepID=UPI0030EE997C